MVSRGYWLVAGSATTLQPRKPAPLLTLRATVAGCSYISKLFRVRARARVRARMFIFTLQPATIRRKPAPILALSGFNLFFKAATLLQLLKLPPPRAPRAGEISLFSGSGCF
jgi:hypothetical protein